MIIILASFILSLSAKGKARMQRVSVSTYSFLKRYIVFRSFFAHKYALWIGTINKKQMCIVTNNAKAYVNRSANKFKKRLRLFLNTMSAYTNVSSDLPTMQMRACLSMSYKFTDTQEQWLYCGQPTRILRNYWIALLLFSIITSKQKEKKKKNSCDSTKFSRVFKGFHQKTQ